MHIRHIEFGEKSTVQDHFNEKSFRRNFLTGMPFDRNTVLTEHRLTECHLTESAFDRITV
jgi:hypothetical protein